MPVVPGLCKGSEIHRQVATPPGRGCAMWGIAHLFDFAGMTGEGAVGQPSARCKTGCGGCEPSGFLSQGSWCVPSGFLPRLNWYVSREDREVHAKNAKGPSP